MVEGGKLFDNCAEEFDEKTMSVFFMSLGQQDSNDSAEEENVATDVNPDKVMSECMENFPALDNITDLGEYRIDERLIFFLLPNLTRIY